MPGAYIFKDEGYAKAKAEYDRKAALQAQPPGGAQAPPLAWGAKVGPEFADKVRDMSRRRKWDPNGLMGIMSFETGSTFDPSIQNRGGSSYYGLIQMGDDQIAEVGLKQKEFRNLSAVDQLDYVEKYLAKRLPENPSISDMYAAVIRPASVGAPDDSPFYSSTSKEYRANQPLDTDENGVISKGEAAALIRKRIAEGLLGGNVR